MLVLFLKNEVISLYKIQTKCPPLTARAHPGAGDCRADQPWKPGASKNKSLTNASIRQQMLLWINEQDSDEWILSRQCRAWSSKLSTCFLLSVYWHRGQETEHHRPQNPSATLLQLDPINDHLLHIAPVSNYPLSRGRQLSRRLC